jgi:hypothetical protein
LRKKKDFSNNNNKQEAEKELRTRFLSQLSYVVDAELFALSGSG